MDFKFNKALVLAPHTDDGEFGCGGTIARLVQEGCEVYMAAFSACERSIQGKYPPDVLIQEIKQASNILGIEPENLFLFEYEVRVFDAHRQSILQDIIALRDKIQPDLVLMPSLDDMHQDHYTMAREGLRAFKFSTIFCYEMPWNNLTFETSCFVHLTEEHIAKKIEALNVYESQAHRPYSNQEFIRALARTRGVQINTQYAEAFNILRFIVQ